jgi:hypothetical protein
MCQKAEEIQSECDHSFENTVDECNFWGHGATWLPRQDQLQEIIKELIGDLPNITYRVLYSFNYFVSTHDENRDTPTSLDSFEQLWLAFVMAEKYQKVWDGSDWIKGDPQ